MTPPLRLALVGAGAIGSAYAEASRLVPEIDLVYVADTNAGAASSLAASMSLEAIADPMRLADTSKIDLALICTPPNSHEELAAGFLEAGVPVMCEKPLAPGSVAARRILAIAARTGTPLTMASKFRFVDDVVRAREMIQSGDLGDVVRVEVAFSSAVDMSKRWNSDPSVSGGGVIIDNGTHAVDIIRYLLGPIDSVLAASASPANLRVEDTASLLLRTHCGHLGSIDLSWSFDRMTERYVAAFGTKGSLEVGWRNSRVSMLDEREPKPFGGGYSKIDALAANLRNVARGLKDETDWVVTSADAIASVAVVEAAYSSIASGRWRRVHSRMQERISA